jgi:hypothetical protein
MLAGRQVLLEADDSQVGVGGGRRAVGQVRS